MDMELDLFEEVSIIDMARSLRSHRQVDGKTTKAFSLGLRLHLMRKSELKEQMGSIFEARKIEARSCCNLRPDHFSDY